MGFYDSLQPTGRVVGSTKRQSGSFYSSLMEQDKKLLDLGIDRSKNKLKIGNFTYTKNNDGTYSLPNGGKRTVEQLIKLAGGEKQYQQNEKIIKEQGKITPGVVAQEFGNATYNTLVQPVVDTVNTFQTQAKIGANAGQSSTNISAAQFYLKANEQDYKSGKISKSVYDSQKKKYEAVLKRDTTNLKSTEKKYGAKYDPSAGALSTFELATLFGVPGALDVQAGKDALKSVIKPKSLPSEVVTPIKAKLSEEVKSLSTVDNTIKSANVNKLKLGSDTISEPLDQQQVSKYVNDIRSGKPIEPIVVSRQNGQLFVQDGAHRLAAAKELGISNIPVVEQKTSGSALKLQSQAIENGVKADLGDLATYSPGSYKTETDKAIQLVKDNPVQALDIATGKIPGDNIIHEVAVKNALKEQAIQSNDYKTLQELAKSPLQTQTSEAAQRLGAEGYGQVTSSLADPLQAMSDVSQARKTALSKAYKTAPENLIPTEVAKIAKNIKEIKPKTWEDFVKSLEC